MVLAVRNTRHVPSATLRFVDVTLSWERASAGRTAVLRRRAAGLGWEELARTTETSYVVRGLHPERAHAFAAAGVLGDGGLEPEDDWERVRVAPVASSGTPALPSVPTYFAAAQSGDQLTFRWTPADDGVSATFEIRVGDTWEDGTLVAEDLTTSPHTWSWPSSGTHDFHLKAIDRLGHASRAAATLSISIQPLGDHATESETDESATWPGTATNLENDAGALQLEQLPLQFGAATDPFGSFAGVPCFAKTFPEGTYETVPIDAGATVKERLEIEWGTVQPLPVPPPFGSVRRPALGKRHRRDGGLLPPGTRTWATKQSWRVTPLEPVDVAVEIDTSQTAAGAWDGWRPYVPGVHVHRRLRVRITLRGDGLRFVRLPRLVIRRRRFNLKDEGLAVLPGGVPIEVFLAQPFQSAPHPTASIVAGGTAVRIEVSVVTPTSFSVEAFDGGGTSVPATLHWHALGMFGVRKRCPVSMA